MPDTETLHDAYLPCNWRERPEAFIKYIEEHAQTPRGLILYRHLVFAKFLAGWDLSGIFSSHFNDNEYFVPLSDYKWKELCEDAKANLARKPLPSDWTGTVVNIVA